MSIFNLVFSVLCKCFFFLTTIQKCIYWYSVGWQCMWKLKGNLRYQYMLCNTCSVCVWEGRHNIFYMVYWRRKEDEGWRFDYLDLYVHLCHWNWFPFLSQIFCIGSQVHFISVGSIVSANECLRWVNFHYFCPLKCGEVWNVFGGAHERFVRAPAGLYFKHWFGYIDNRLLE